MARKPAQGGVDLGVAVGFSVGSLQKRSVKRDTPLSRRQRFAWIKRCISSLWLQRRCAEGDERFVQVQRMSPRRLSRRLSRALGVGAGVVLTFVALGAYLVEALEPLEEATFDARSSIQGRRSPPRNIVIVAIDDATFRDPTIGRYPLRRSLHAQAVQRLSEEGAKVIAYDIQFTAPSEPAEDTALIQAVKDAGNVVLATSEAGVAGETGVLGGDAMVALLNARVGYSLFVVNPGDRSAVFPRGSGGYRASPSQWRRSRSDISFEAQPLPLAQRSSTITDPLGQSNRFPSRASCAGRRPRTSFAARSSLSVRQHPRFWICI